MQQSRIRQLDGLRGLAVSLVVLNHHNLLNAGWLGVDLFFVLSGYLITNILRKTKDSPTYWPQFWVKRTTRILPPLLLLLLLTYLFRFSLSVMQAAAYAATLGDLLAYERKHYELLRPLWSLAVEEHFYLLWPLAVRLLSRDKLIALLISLVIAEPIARFVATYFIPGWEFTYFLTPFRLDGLCLGALLAVLFEVKWEAQAVKKLSVPLLFVASGLWILLRLVLDKAFTRDNPTPTFNAACYSLVSVASAALLAYLILNPDSFLSRMLSLKPLVMLGEISYGVYLFHELGLTIATRINPTAGNSRLFVWDIVPVLLFSAASFRLLELPIIERGRAYASAMSHRREHAANATPVAS
jgi:peptidoglycan/LPS O-acetylase OafA/YrhL